MSKPDCSKCKSYNTCDYRKHGEICLCWKSLGEFVYSWDGTSGNL